jgi:hypothetical protein
LITFSLVVAVVAVVLPMEELVVVVQVVGLFQQPLSRFQLIQLQIFALEWAVVVAQQALMVSQVALRP